MIDGTSTDVFGLATYPISEEIQQSAEFVARLKALSNKKYTQPRQKVEEQISKTLSTTKLDNLKSSEENKVVNPVVEEQKLPEEQKDKKQIKQEKQPEKDITSSEDLNDVFEWVVKLKFNYGLFVVTPKYEWLLHKKNIHLPEWINWKDYYQIWDKIRVKLIEIKEVDGQKKAVWESV